MQMQFAERILENLKQMRPKENCIQKIVALTLVISFSLTSTIGYSDTSLVFQFLTSGKPYSVAAPLQQNLNKSDIAASSVVGRGELKLAIPGAPANGKAPIVGTTQRVIANPQGEAIRGSRQGPSPFSARVVLSKSAFIYKVSLLVL